MEHQWGIEYMHLGYKAMCNHRTKKQLDELLGNHLFQKIFHALD